ncbi:PAS domain-containing protein [Sphingomonas sp. S1-29]|uniref:HWE histidine kinase domain-containing protein n=1 Tax=Sphingomonas sp. S1-29 TaxID=2991074 RepID=UPI00223F59D6|nr:HWE histidine kinase domain-containing protein [Sphingomonas sp. S1-29]UZK68718.1 PAS domain-containing protein [Sphingomonas sp. S1-29]
MHGTAPFVDEAIRQATIAAHDLHRFDGDERFDAITAFAAALIGAPVALVTLLDAERQRHLSRVGTDVDALPRSASFCAHAIESPGIMIVRDATLDPRFADNPVVTGDLHVRFYAGAPLLSAEGFPLGALCVLDTEPRDGLTPLQAQGLTTLAASVAAILHARRENKALRDSEMRLRSLADALPHLVWAADPDGVPLWINQRWVEATGVAIGLDSAEAFLRVIHPDDHALITERWRTAKASGEAFECELRILNPAGEPRWAMIRSVPFRDDRGVVTHWFGTATDTHGYRLAIEERELISNELSHRIKNIFAVVSGLIHAASRGADDAAALPTSLIDRVAALGRAHDFVRPRAADGSGKPVTLHGLLGTLFDPYRAGEVSRVRVAGANPQIDDRATTPLSLLYHELATNAAKYGALSGTNGWVTLDCIAADDGGFELLWREQGGPPIHPGDRPAGFGSKLIESSAIRQLGGTLERTWHEGGLAVRLVLPAGALAPA